EVCSSDLSTLLYEGKEKKVYFVEGDSEKLILSYKDDATAFNGKKKSVFPGKGKLNNEISAAIFEYLQDQGISSHFVQKLNETEQLVYQTEIIPLEVVVRNIAAGSITRRLPIEEKTVFPKPLVEFYYKSDIWDDPLINDDHACILTGLSLHELKEIKDNALKINDQLRKLFAGINLTLVDFKLEFGKRKNTIILADEISPDTCRLWDKDTMEPLDKDVFRKGTGNLLEVYQELLNRL